jgi:hypothetical protein
MNGDGHPPAGEAGRGAATGVPASGKSRDGAPPPGGVALVSGAARGIGTAVAGALAAEGIQVAVECTRRFGLEPAGRKDIADAARFPVAERAWHITMQDLYVDGGATLRA